MQMTRGKNGRYMKSYLQVLLCLLLMTGIASGDPGPQADAAPLMRPGLPGEIVPQIKGPNLLSNGNFDHGFDHWTLGHAKETEGSANVISGQFGKFVRVQKGTGLGPIRMVSEPIAVEPDTDYVVTFLYHTDNAVFGDLCQPFLVQAGSADQLHVDSLSITSPQQAPSIDGKALLNSRTGDWRRKARAIHTAKATHFVCLAVLIEGPPVTVDFTNFYLAKPETEMRPTALITPETVIPRDEVERILAQRSAATAEVREEQGTPHLYVDGKLRAPDIQLSDIINTFRSRYADFAAQGVNIHMVAFSNPAMKHWTGPGQYDFAKIDAHMWDAVQRDPHGYFILYINVHPYPQWSKLYPQDIAQNAQGKVPNGTAINTYTNVPASYYSPEYRRQVKELMHAYVQHMMKQPYGKAIIGFFLGGGEDGQFYWQLSATGQTVEDGLGATDAILFRQWLKQHYNGDVAALRAAWGDKDVTFETARQPVSASKYPGTFFDPKRDRKIIDFEHFLNEEVANLFLDVGAICKNEAGKKIIFGMYYGRGQSGSCYPMYAETSRILPSNIVDFMGAQPGYDEVRQTGAPGFLNWVFDSERLHGKIPMAEIDYRTWRGPFTSIAHDFNVGRFWNPRDLQNAMAREAGKLLSVGGGLWWMEMTGGWFHAEPMEAIGKINRVAEQIERSPDGGFRPADVAVIVDEDSFFYSTEQMNIHNGPVFYSVNVQQPALYSSGVPFDMYYSKDIIDHNLDGYKVYIFLNLYHVSEKTRGYINDHLKRNGKVLVWEYAPGYLTDDGLSLSSMESLTGIKLGTDNGGANSMTATYVPDAKGEQAKALLRGVKDPKMGNGVDISTQRFTVDDPTAQPLGTYLSDGKVAGAVKQFDHYTSVYVGPPAGLTPRFVNNLAHLGNALVLMEPGNMVMMQRNNFVCIHGIEGGNQTLHLPFKATVVDLFKNSVLATDTDTVPLSIPLDGTLWLGLRHAP